MARIVWALLLALMAGSAQAQIFKCLGADGAVAYSDKPCKTGDAQSAVTVRGDPAAARVSLEPRCESPELVLVPVPGSGEDSTAFRDEILRRATPGQRYAWGKTLRNQVASGGMLQAGTHPSGTMHFCFGPEAIYRNRDREIIALPDGRVFSHSGVEADFIGEDVFLSLQTGCEARIKRCITKDMGLLDRCIATVPTCGDAGADCCPGVCLEQFKCWSDQGRPPSEAFDYSFGHGCPASSPPPAEQVCRR